MSELVGFPLNGCDAFMLAMDSGMKRDGSSRNVCHLLVTLAPGADLSKCIEQLSLSPALNEVIRLRLSTSLLRTPRWIITLSATSRHSISSLESCVEELDLQRLILASTLDPKREAPFGVIALPRFCSGPSLLFYWHHALCDAHGGEELVRRIVSSTHGTLSNLTPTTTPQVPRHEAARRAQHTKRLIFKKSSPTIARLARNTSQAPLHRFARIAFTEEQTEKIDAGVRKLTGGMFPSALFLAATARAFSRTLPLGTSDDRPLFIPVPHDMRRTTKQPSPLSNQVSVAFFRLEPTQDNKLVDTTNDVIGQLQETIAEHHHHGMLDFLRFVRRLPSRLLWKVIEYPTAGHPASFYFSDIGASLSRLETACGEEVRYAAHYPPNLAPPGFTTVWSRYRGRIEVTLCYDQTSLSEQNLSAFIENINNELLGAAA